MTEDMPRYNGDPTSRHRDFDRCMMRFARSAHRKRPD
jgi:hypothetical protein